MFARRPVFGVRVIPLFHAGWPDSMVLAYSAIPLCATLSAFTAVSASRFALVERRPDCKVKPTPQIRYAFQFPLLPPDGHFWGDGLFCYAARPSDRRPDSGSVAFFALRPAA
jgi:hypothetical protein